ncbi:MAG: copper resistance system multicopper oxidase [Methylophaga sp.]|nr:copper resistance system multicopper oxidase [Methylophaga sp.]
MNIIRFWLTPLLATLLSFSALANQTEYSLIIESQPVNLTGKTVDRITINGTIPGPVLHFTEGDEAVIHVTNKLDEPTSVHWHGLLLPPKMDGVPGMGGFSGIAPGETFTYRFPLRQNGTYWYHAHSGTQEQDGHYAGLVIHPKDDSPVQADRDYVVLISDFHEHSGQRIMQNLKKSPHYYNYAQRTVGDFMADVREQGFANAWQNTKAWGQMRMSPTDLADVSGYTFLINGKTPEQNWTGLFTPGERIRLRFINASAMSIYDLRITGLPMTVVQADGQYVEPVTVDELRFSVAETYDVIVQPQVAEAFTIVAESIDRAGFALATLAPQAGMRGPQPTHRSRALLTMTDMGHGDHAEHQDHSAHDHHDHHSHHGHHGHDVSHTETTDSGWAQAGTPEGHTALSYADLRSLTTQADTRPASRDIVVTLDGSMERFIWTLNGKKFSDPDFRPIQLAYNERVRIIFKNNTMMAHPMHLHGMFMQLENGQDPDYLPNKHVVNVPPGQQLSVLLTADEPGEWMFHCHLLYHMAAGMMGVMVVAEPDADPTDTHADHHQHHGGHHHGHH